MGSPNPLSQLRRSGAASILIVDDDEYVRRALQAALRGLRYRLVTARTAAEAERLALLEPPALAIVDVGLPDRDGYRLTADLRRAGLEATRIVILTGHAPDEAAAELAGADAIMAKPFRLHRFLDLIQAQLRAGTAA